MFVASLDGFGETVAAIAEALAAAGYAVEEHDKSGGLGDIWEDIGEGLASSRSPRPAATPRSRYRRRSSSCAALGRVPGIGLVVHLDNAR